MFFVFFLCMCVLSLFKANSPRGNKGFIHLNIDQKHPEHPKNPFRKSVLSQMLEYMITYNDLGFFFDAYVQFSSLVRLGRCSNCDLLFLTYVNLWPGKTFFVIYAPNGCLMTWKVPRADVPLKVNWKHLSLLEPLVFYVNLLLFDVYASLHCIFLFLFKVDWCFRYKNIRKKTKKHALICIFLVMH